MKRRKYNVMPIGLQKYNLKRIFEKLNPWATFEDISLDFLDPKSNYNENLENAQDVEPDYRWVMPSEKRKRDYPHFQDMEDSEGNPYLEIRVRVKPHPVKAKGKEYQRGRIQVTTDKSWIGTTAIIKLKPKENRARIGLR